jgi:hypothetical protein
MAFAFRRITAPKYQEISDAAASFSAKAVALQTYGTIQSIKAVNSTTGEITEAIAFKDPSRGNSLVVKYAKDSIETSASNIEAVSSVSSGIISGLINTNYGDSGGGGEPGPVFEIYVLYQYFDAKEACAFGDRGDGMSEPPQPIIVYVYNGEVFEDEKGQRLFNGRNLWFYVTDRGGTPIGTSWNIDMNGAVINEFICG